MKKSDTQIVETLQALDTTAARTPRRSSRRSIRRRCAAMPPHVRRGCDKAGTVPVEHA